VNPNPVSFLDELFFIAAINGEREKEKDVKER
jgi:hypothetical protein